MQINLKFFQVALIWTASAGLMIAVFLFGLFAGREQGIDYALAGQEDSSLRLPLTLKQSSSKKTNAKPKSEEEIRAAETKNKRARLAEEKAEPAAELVKKQVVKKPFETKKVESIAKIAQKTPVKEVPKEVAKKPANKPAKELVAKKNLEPVQVTSKPAKIGPGWYVQALAANTEREAKKLVSELSKKDFLAVIQEAQVKKITYYRVLVGPFKGKSKAAKAKSLIDSMKSVPSTPFVKQIK